MATVTGYTAAKVDQLIAGVSGGGGGGSSITADDTPAKPAEGTSASYLVTSAVTWPAGLVWSTDPDGGTAPTISGTALVSFFTLGGVTRAVMGATFQASGTTTTTTSAGTTTTTTSAGTTTTTTSAGPAVFFTDFSEYATGPLPTGWTWRWNSPSAGTSGVQEEAGLTGGKFLRLAAASVKVGFSLDSLGTVSGPVEVVTRFRAPVSAFIAHAIRIHGSGDNATANAYYANFAATTSKAAKYTAGAVADIGTPASRTLAVNTWSWARMRVDSGTVYLRWWADGDTEPATWNVEVADTAHTSGWVGVGAYKDVDFDVVGIALGGGTAPKAAS